MVELRKRKTPPPATDKPAKKRPGPKSKAEKAKEAAVSTVSKVKAAVTGGGGGGGGEESSDVGANGVEADAQKAANAAESTKAGTTAAPAAAAGLPKVGDVIDLATFGGEVQTQEGTTVTLKQLVEESEAGVVLFTYPKASTPGCTAQACAFRDGHSTLTSTGLAIYGLSADSPKANTSFKTRQSLPYTLLCDPAYKLIGAIGMQLKPNEKKTKRGVFAVDKQGTVLLAEQGGPMPTVDATKRLVDGLGGKVKLTRQPSKEEKEGAATAGEVADTAAKLDA